MTTTLMRMGQGGEETQSRTTGARGMLGALAVAAFVLALGTAAHAGEMATPLVSPGSGQLAQCIVTNIGTKVATVDVELINPAGHKIVTLADVCGAPLAARVSCSVTAFADDEVYCHVTSNSTHIRAAINVIDSNNKLVTVVPATK